MTCLSRFQASFFPITWVKPRLWNTVNEWDHMLHRHHDPVNSLDGTPVGFGTWKMDHYIVCCTEYLCTSLCLAPGERGQAYSTPGIWPNVFSFGWGIERDLTKLKISRVGIFDKVAKEPESYNHQLPPPPPPLAQCWANCFNTDGMEWKCPFCVIEDLTYKGEKVYFMAMYVCICMYC